MPPPCPRQCPPPADWLRSLLCYFCTTTTTHHPSSADPFADSQEERRDQTKVHVRVQQRSGRKCITTVQGLADDLDLKRILKAFKKNFRCVHLFQQTTVVLYKRAC